MPLLQIELFGQFSLVHHNAVLAFDTATHQSLLAYLITHTDQLHSRQKLAFMCWPDSAESQSRTNLRKAIFQIRQTLPEVERFLEVTNHAVCWRSDAPCEVDVWDFEAAVDQYQKTSLTNSHQHHLEQAVNAYHGDFLPGHYDEWIIAARESYRTRYLLLIEELLTVAEKQRRYVEAIDLARRLLGEDPLHEGAYRRLMRLFTLNGNFAGALRTYHDCSTRLQQELGVQPSQATRALYEQLLNIEGSVAPPPPSQLPLVGREEAWQALQSAWAQCSRERAGIVLLSGEAGIGKTRLAEEMLEWARRLGITSLSAVCYPSERHLAYAPLAALLRGESMKRIMRRLGKRKLSECSRLLPELLDQNTDLPGPTPLSESWQRQHFFSVVAHTILQMRQPFLLFIDDLPWCDTDSLDWLLYLMSYDPRARFMLIGAARCEDISDGHQFLAWQRQLEKDGRITTIDLQRLDSADSALLASHVLKRPLDRVRANRIYAETEGNPLFVVETARYGLAPESTRAQDVILPPKVQSVIEARLARLSQPAYRLAQLASVIGRSFTFALLDRADRQGGDDVVRGLDELWQQRIIRERDVDAYDFSHDKIRKVAYESLSQARRRQLHCRIWQALEILHAANLDPASGQIAAHCEAAGSYQEAIAYYRRAAKAAQHVFANEDTLNHLQSAIDLTTKVDIDPRQVRDIYEQQGDILIRIGRYDEAEAALVKSLSLAAEPQALSRLYRKIANSQQLRRQHERAFSSWQMAEESLGSSSADWISEIWQEWLWIQLEKGWVLYWSGQLEAHEGLLRTISPVVTDHGTPLQQGFYYQRLVMIALRRDRHFLSDETIEHARRSFAITQESGDSGQVAFSQFVLGHTLNYHGWEGNLVEADFQMRSALKLAEELGDILLQTRCLTHLCLNQLRQGQMNSARTFLPQAMAAAKKANSLEYVVVIEGLQAWYAWRDQDFDTARRLGRHAFTLVKDLPFSWPVKWTAAFPLISIALNHDELENAIAYARQLMSPDQMLLRDDLMSALQAAVDAWDLVQQDRCRAYLRKSLELAEKYQYL